MSWTTDYLGLPFTDLGRTRAGCDCWGLARLVYRDLLNIDLPSLDTSLGVSGPAKVAEMIGETASAEPWRAVAEPLPFDVLVFRRGRYAQHLGICVNRRWMLHMDRTGAKLAEFTSALWTSRAIGAWRHAEVRNG